MSGNLSLNVLDRVRIASPCSMKWEDLHDVGDGERVRHCDQCNLNVYNFSAMTREEAEAMVINKQGRLCAGFFQRPDGTIITRDCPVGLAAVRARAARVASRIAAALAFLVSGGVLLGMKSREDARLRGMEPFATISRWLAPPPIAIPPVRGQVQMMGEVCMPPALAPSGGVTPTQPPSGVAAANQPAK
jgi:hypothetical protein